MNIHTEDGNFRWERDAPMHSNARPLRRANSWMKELLPPRIGVAHTNNPVDFHILPSQADDASFNLARMRPDLRRISLRWSRVGRVFIDACLLSTNMFVLHRLFRAVLSSMAGEYWLLFSLTVALILLLLNSSGVYEPHTANPHTRHISAVGISITVATLIIIILAHLVSLRASSVRVVLCAGVLNFVVLSGWRLISRKLVDHGVIQEQPTRNVLIIGAGRRPSELSEFLTNNRQLGYAVRDILYTDRNDIHFMGSDLPRLARAQFIDEILITQPCSRHLVHNIVSHARRIRLDVTVVPDLYDEVRDQREHRPDVDYLGLYPTLSIHHEPAPPFTLVIKRAMDALCATVALIIAVPVLIAIAVAIKFDSPGPVFYRSYRRGKKGQLFSCWKFRTMTANADNLKDTLRVSNEREGPFFKLANDPRVTSLGKWLRKCSLDELPQLWNVVRGDMSLVGPRPHPLDDCERYKLEHLCRLDVTPGLTGLWQITSRRDPSFETSIRLDREYIEKWSLWKDLTILLKTVPAILRADGQ